ncbi:MULTISPECIES: DUF4317 domain-containing protein [unclassified Sporosarcina]|uniref:DUF4317 domain-containing protein n=1 Tax=unclassified Sporosarcina TaxID=2647733 RepID=UPI00203C7055|nr:MULTISPECIES: DUF4317 domain-containing protein [unclassified Sporosarcina]GKV64064.1 hypothetical protein NCCP2331_02170 [Sporosarcina sp. NCCP-2331]GLB56361.1 hypothetical protein NCCP2378_21480 [Sporosarcina sp. NCCP-2378]
MNKNDIADIRKRFKVDSDLLTITDIYNIYIRQESSEIYHEESQAFALLDREQQELFLANFKKVLGGKLGMKLFEVKFEPQSDEQPDHAQKLLYAGLQAEEADEWKDEMQHLALKMVKEVQYEKDLVVTFIRGNYFKKTKRNSEETEIDARDEVFTTPFILCSMNHTDLPKRSIVFDFIGREFKANTMIDPIINLASPVGGFLFPSFTDNAADVNHILYAAGRMNKPDYRFIEEVLNGEEVMTAADDKAVFEEIIKHVVGEEVASQTLANVYEAVHRLTEVDEEEEDPEEPPALDKVQVERVLKMSGVDYVDAEQVKNAFESVVDNDMYEMKASHIVPSYTSKSIKIETKVANISVSPQDLKYVKQVNYDGKRCILIEVEEDTIIDGFKLISEKLLN